MPPPACAPLVQFGDRLFFTTFAGIAPNQQALNASIAGPQDNPPLRRPIVISNEQTPPKYYFFTIDHSLNYESFYEDWGPLNLANVFRTLILIHELIQNKETETHRLVLYSSSDPRRKANAALLMALFVMIVLRRPPWEAFQPLAELEFMPFRDAGRARPDFNLTIQDCLWGFWKALQNGLCDMNQFSVEEYEYYEKVENGDWNWITPGFIAFASPVEPNYVKKTGGETVSKSALERRLPVAFDNCLDYFSKRNVKLVVRLNHQLYDKQHFLSRGIEHLELYFDDGTNPTDEIVRKFIQVSDPIITSGGVVAIHCKAGLGRTGTLIGAYLIWKYGFTANEAIAFMRICRPGSVVGPQQHFMYLKQLEWSKWSAIDELKGQGTNVELAVGEDVMDETSDGRHTPTRAVEKVEVTTPKHIQATEAAVGNIANPPQPRKSPEKNTTVDPDEELHSLGDVPDTPTKPHMSRPRASRSLSTGKVGTREAIEAAARVESSVGPTRQLRSQTAASASTTPAKSTLAKGGRIPKLARAKDAESSTMNAGARNRLTQPRPPPMSNAPSRLPTLVPAKRSYVVVEADSGAEADQPPNAASGRSMSPLTGLEKSPAKNGRASPSPAVRRSPRKSGKLKLVDDTPSSNEWINGQQANSVIASSSKSGDRPSLRNVKRRRSSFSSVDLLA